MQRMIADPLRARPLRLFLSSTFRDMQVERNILARLVLPRQRAILTARNVALQEVDLRWGVTETMSRDGGAVAICLRELADCFPLVFAMIGRRAGWIPPREALDQFGSTFAATLPAGATMTEIEIRYALYLADSNPDVKIPVLVRSDRLSAESDPEPELAGTEAFRTWILRAPAVRAVTYDSFEQFERLADEELGRILTPQMATGIAWRAAAPALPELARVRDLDALSVAASRRRPTLVTGARGSGISWLAQRWAREDPEGLYIDGRGGGAADLAQALRLPGEQGRDPFARKISEFSPERYGDAGEVMARTLHARMTRQPATRRIVFDHYEDGHAAEARADLGWIQTRLPRGCGVLLITRSERLRAQAGAMGWQLHEVQKIGADEAARFGERYLKAFSKHLMPAQVGMLETAPWITSFASVILALDELRRHGAIETLDGRLAELVACQTDTALVEELVSGLRSVMLKDWPAAVEDALLAIRMSVRGLTEQEIQGAAARESDEAKALPAHLWSAIRVSLNSALVARGDLVDVSGGPVMTWIESRFLARHDEVGRVAARLSSVLDKAEPARRWTESPRLAEVLGGETGLEQFLSDPANTVALTDVGETFADGWLERLSSDARRRVASVWIARLQTGDQRRWALGLMLARADEFDAALELLKSDGMGANVNDGIARIGERETLVAFLSRDYGYFERLAAHIARGAEPIAADAPGAIATGLAVLAAAADGYIVLDRKFERRLAKQVDAATRGSNEPLLEGQVQIYHGQLLLMRGKWYRAASAFGYAARIARRHGFARLLCRALERLATVQLERNRFRAARHAAGECREVAFHTRLAEFEALAFERQIEVERRRANWAAAYALAESFIARCRDGLCDVQRAKATLATLESHH